MNATANISDTLTLCRFSRSEILASSILQKCPLSLTGAQSKKCPCKRRKNHVGPYDLRVIECLFPKTYRGELIRQPEQLRQRIAERQSSSNVKSKPGEITMSTAIAEPPKNGVAKPSQEKAAAPSSSIGNSPANNPGLWCGIDIPIIGVCGEKWMGKTLFVSSIDPEHTAMVDLEGSSATYSNIPFARRWDLHDEMLRKHNRVPTPIECFEWFRDLITAIKPGEYRVLAVDPITDIEQGMVDWVQKNPDHFGHTKNQYDNAMGIMWGDVKSYWKMLLGIVATKVETFAFTAHMGAVWKGKQPVEGKRKAKGKETLFELASLYLQVERPLDEKGRQSDKPSARVLKSRLALSAFVDGDIVHKPILPPYIKEATPKKIREYIRTPPDYSKLKSSEIAPPEQMSEDDKLLVNAEIAENNRVAAEAQLSRMEKMRQAAEEQARMKREREAQQEANATLAETVAAASAGRASDGTGSTLETAKATTETVTTATGTVLPKSHEMLSGVQEAGDRADLKVLHAAVKELFTALQSTPATIADVLGKRGVKSVEDLTAAQAEEIRGKLQVVVNKRLEKAKAAEAAPFK